MSTNNVQKREILLINAFDEAVILTDKNGLILHANPAACATLGQTCQTLLNQQLHEQLVLNEQDESNIQAVCLKPIDNTALKTSFICGDDVRKIYLPTETGEINIALIWCPKLTTVTTRDKSTGLLDRAMLIQQIAPLLEQKNLANPHSLVKIQVTGIKTEHLRLVHPEQLESLMTDIAALLSPHIRQRDLLARSDMDCFSLLLRGCDLAHAQKVTQKLIKEIKSYHEDYPDTNLPAWRICTGIIPLTSGKTIEDTFEQAKKSCHQAYISGDDVNVLIEGSWENLSND